MGERVRVQMGAHGVHMEENENQMAENGVPMEECEVPMRA